MVVMMALMTGLPHAISYEKDIGTLDGMLAAPIHRLSIILGKVMAQTIRGMTQGFIILLLAVILFSVVIQGNILLVIFLIILTVFSFCRSWYPHNIIHGKRGNSYNGYDDAYVPYDVPKRCILPDTADAMVHARHIQSPAAHVRC
jgi:ABC-type transport system involved in cytochrome c biogenesis permease component